jgi:hypothetical protein
MKTANELAALWLQYKKDENDAASKRLEVERMLLEQIPCKEEGSMTTQLPNGWRVKTQGRFTYKADIDDLLRRTAAWPEKPVKTKVEADESLLRAIRLDRPDLWRQIAPAITMKPAKTYITIEENNNGI